MKIFKKLGKVSFFFLILLFLAFTTFSSTSCTLQKTTSKPTPTSRNDKKNVKTKKPTVIEFYAPW